jgi:predicted RNA-binding protein with PUA-like domain
VHVVCRVGTYYNAPMNYWLMKSEPSCYGIDDLQRDRKGMWDDVRNYQARNFMRTMKKGDQVLFYHSSCDVIGVVGVAEIHREAYPDPTQFDETSYKYDAMSTKENPRWDAVDLKFITKFREPVTLGELKLDPFFRDMLVIKKGMRLSVQPVAKKHFDRILRMREYTPKTRTQK